MKFQGRPPKLYMSAPHDCSYLPEETASTLMLEPDYPLNDSQFTVLLKSGYRRSGDIVYKPHCHACNACVSVRIPVWEYAPSRGQKRCYRRNHDVQTDIMSPCFRKEHFDLFCRYQSWRHSGDTMDHNNPARYRQFMIDSIVKTIFMEFRIAGELVALSVCDLPNEGISAVYTIFDPVHEKRGLGTFAIMKQIEYAKEYNLDHVYLGYWIKQCQKMNYKIRFRPLEGYVDREWQIINDRMSPCRDQQGQ